MTVPVYTGLEVSVTYSLQKLPITGGGVWGAGASDAELGRHPFIYVAFNWFAVCIGCQ